MELQRPDDALLSAWLDGELDEATRERVELWLREHAEDAARLRLCAADRDALRARFDPVLDEPIPEALLRTVRNLGQGDALRSAQRGGQDHGHGRARIDGVAADDDLGAAAHAAGWAPWRLLPRGAGLRAGVLAGTLTGALLGALGGAALVWQWQPQRELSLVGRSVGWPQRAALAHAVYAPEVRHPVEVNVATGSQAEQRAQEEHLARWLSKRMDMPVKLFDLRAQGFELVGGRLLPDAIGPSAQLMYQNSAGQRVTLYLRRPDSNASTAFRFLRDGELGMFYWVEDGYGCAIVGKLPRPQLLALAEAVYRQVEQDLPGPRPRPAS